MKRAIFITLLSAFLFSLLLAYSVVYLEAAKNSFESLQNEYRSEYIEAIQYSFNNALRNGLLFLAGSLCTIALYALFAVKEFKVFQPYVDKLNAKRNARKTERLARKQAKSETDKQKRIEELQAELDTLKKGDTPPSED